MVEQITNTNPGTSRPENDAVQEAGELSVVFLSYGPCACSVLILVCCRNTEVFNCAKWFGSYWSDSSEQDPMPGKTGLQV